MKNVKLKLNFKDKKLLFLFAVNLLPIFLMFLTSLVTGSKIRTMWMTPYYLFFGTFVVYLLKEQINLKKLKDESKILKGSIEIYPLDISIRKNVASIFEKIQKDLGNVGTVILNAAINEPINAKNFSSQKLDKLMQVNYTGTINCLDPVIKKFISNKSGKIAVVASLAGYIGFPEERSQIKVVSR